MQTTGGVNDNHVGIVCNSRSKCVVCNRSGVGAHALLDDRDIGTVSPLHQLLNGSRTECIGSAKINLLASFLVLMRQFSDSCSLSHTVHTNNHNHIRLSRSCRDIECVTAIVCIVLHQQLRNLILEQVVEFFCIHELVSCRTLLHTVNDFESGLYTDIRCHENLLKVIEHLVIYLALAGNGAGNLPEYTLFGLGQSLVKNLFLLFTEKTEYSHILPNIKILIHCASALCGTLRSHSSIKLEHCKERLLRNLDITDLLHTFLTLLLFLKQLAFT